MSAVDLPRWHGMLGSNERITESKSAVLPLHQSRIYAATIRYMAVAAVEAIHLTVYARLANYSRKSR